MTMINKKTITTTILNNPSIQRTLNKLVINFAIMQIKIPKSKMQCGTIYQEIA